MSHEQALAQLGRWREVKRVEAEEAALVDQASVPIPLNA